MDNLASFSDIKHGRTSYIVEFPSGQITWCTRDEVVQLHNYYMVKYDVVKNYFYYPVTRRKEVLEFLEYERKMVT